MAQKPEEGVDSIVAAADIIMRLQTVVSRMTAPTNPVVITIGQIHAGTAPNIIPDGVTLGGTLRALNNETPLISSDTKPKKLQNPQPHFTVRKQSFYG